MMHSSCSCIDSYEGDCLGKQRTLSLWVLSKGWCFGEAVTVLVGGLVVGLLDSFFFCFSTPIEWIVDKFFELA